jgi:uncharacterized protein YxjI
MQFYIHQNTGTETLFIISDCLGQPVYRVKGDSLSIGSKYYLIDNNENEAARIFSVGLSALSKYTIYIDDKERARVILNLTATTPKQPIKIKGVKGIRWRFRGDLITRSYDIIDVDSTVIMTHGRCWHTGCDCFAVDVTNKQDVLLSLCIAVIIDSTVIASSAAVLPVG